MPRFAFVGEGVTDRAVINNILIGFFNDKNISLTSLHPENPIIPGGWSNTLTYISTQEFKDNIEEEYFDFVIIQIDTNECEEWGEGLQKKDIDENNIDEFIKSIQCVVIKKIGEEFYTNNKEKIIFAITVHEIECWFLPFISSTKAHQKKIINCVTTVEKIANKKGFSINQKNYQSGKNYNLLSGEMKNNKTLMKKYTLNPSLKYFINNLIEKK